MLKQKSLMFLIFGFSIMMFTGCFYNHYETVKLEEIKFYDINNQEIVGEYVNYFRGNFSRNEEVSNRKLNSAAPVVNYYCATVDSNSTVRVVMKFKVNNSYKVKGIGLVTLNVTGQEGSIDDKMDSIEEIDGFTVVTYTALDITKENNIRAIKYWISNSDEQNSFATRGGNQYIRGFYFYLNNE